MPNPNYLKGIRKERKLVNQARAKGLLALRSAGSHSLIDVVIVDQESRTIRFIQSKPNSMSLKAKESLKQSLSWLDGYFKVEFSVE